MSNVIGATLLLLLIGAIVGFVVGWIAHRDDNRRYAESRSRYLEQQAELARRDELASPRVRWEAERPVVHVHVTTTALPQPQYWQQPHVIDAQIVRDHPTIALPTGNGGA